MEPGALRSDDLRKGALLHGGSLPGTSTLRDLPSSARAVLSPRLSSRPALLIKGLPGAPALRHDIASPTSYRESDKFGEGKFFCCRPAAGSGSCLPAARSSPRRASTVLRRGRSDLRRNRSCRERCSSVLRRSGSWRERCSSVLRRSGSWRERCSSVPRRLTLAPPRCGSALVQSGSSPPQSRSHPPATRASPRQSNAPPRQTRAGPEPFGRNPLPAPSLRSLLGGVPAVDDSARSRTVISGPIGADFAPMARDIDPSRCHACGQKALRLVEELLPARARGLHPDDPVCS